MPFCFGDILRISGARFGSTESVANGVEVLSHIDYVANHFAEWLTDQEERKSDELEVQTSVADLVGMWMMDGGASAAVTYDAFLRAVVVIAGEASSGRVSFEPYDGTERVYPSIPTTSHDWWMLEPIEFEVALQGCRLKQRPPATA